MSNVTAELDTVDFNSTLVHLMNITYVFGMVTLFIELPVICGAAFALYHQVKPDHVTPVYVINLLISDFIQIIGRLINNFTTVLYINVLSALVTMIGLVASILFMVCIALERYLLVVHPLWYRCHHTIKHSILISLVVCAFELLLFVAMFFSAAFISSVVAIVGFAIFLLLPLLLLVFFLMATWRALSRSISVSHKEKKRILGTLALVILMYLVVFFPTALSILSLVSPNSLKNNTHYNMMFVSSMFLDINPLMDPLLYILMKKNVSYALIPLCCRRLCTHEDSREATVSDENVTIV